MPKAIKTRPADPIYVELDAIKRLLILGLIRAGATQAQIAAALGVDQSHISRMFPKGIGAVGRSGKRT